jgi:hypothetical protein
MKRVFCLIAVLVAFSAVKAAEPEGVTADRVRQGVSIPFK